MNARSSAPTARASTAFWRLAGCLVLMLAAGTVMAVRGSAHVARASGPTAPASLNVQPFPGTPDASPQTHVSFPTLSPLQLRTVRVTASRSGAHPGKLVEAPDRRGTDFIPDRPFVTGDHVSVQATLSSREAGLAAGTGGGARIEFSFGVAATATAIGRTAPADAATASGISPNPSRTCSIFFTLSGFG